LEIKKKYCTCVVTLKVVQNIEDGTFTDKLDAEAALATTATTISEAIIEGTLLKQIQAAIDIYNKDYAVSNAQKIQYFKVLNKEFSNLGNKPELTPTMKLKRKVVYETFAKEIESMYSGEYDSMKQK